MFFVYISLGIWEKKSFYPSVSADSVWLCVCVCSVGWVGCNLPRPKGNKAQTSFINKYISMCPLYHEHHELDVWLAIVKVYTQ